MAWVLALLRLWFWAQADGEDGHFLKPVLRVLSRAQWAGDTMGELIKGDVIIIPSRYLVATPLGFSCPTLIRCLG